MKAILKRITNFIPLTLPGVLLTAISIYLIGLEEKADVIATIIAATFLFTLTFALITGVINYFFIKNKLTLSLKQNKKNQKIFSQKDEQFKYQYDKLRLFPFIQLRLNPVFKDSHFQPAPTIVRLQQQRTGQLPLSINFPHRGIWKIDHISCQLEDILGLTRFHFKAATPTELAVEPSLIPRKTLPLVVSSIIPGDELTAHEERLGDYYDLKKYHPSDGAKKIVWKIYAKTKELVSRHPEQSASPSGEALVYCLAGPNDDETARRCLDYLEQINEHDLKIAFDCLGNRHGEARDLPTAIQHCLSAVWSSKHKEDKIFDHINSLISRPAAKSGSVQVKELALFTPHNNKLTQEITKQLAKRGIRLQYFYDKAKISQDNKLRNAFFIADAHAS